MTRIVFFGTPDPAARCLSALAAAGHDIAAVYTRPDRVSGRSRAPRPTPVREAAERLGIVAHTPGSLRGAGVVEGIVQAGADVFVVFAYGRILPAQLLALPPHGAVNVHPSLLPRYRGPSPVVTAILDGAESTGVTIMLLDAGMDTGPVLARSEPMAIGETETGAALTARLFAAGTDLLVETLPGWVSGAITPQPQDESRATVTRLIEKSDGELDFTRPAEQLCRAVRAYDPWPGTFTRWEGRLLKILRATAEGAGAGPPGVVTGSGGGVHIATGRGSMTVSRLQLEGRSAVNAEEFLRGYPGLDGARLPS